MKAEMRGFKLPGRLLETDTIKVDGRPDWYAKGRSTDRPERAQGRHIDNLLIILDECAGVPRPIVNALKGYFTNPGVKMIGIGNPNADLTSPFAEACHERRGEVGVVEIDAHDCPYVGQNWIDARKKEWGESSIEYLTKVLGKWPKDSERKIIPLDWIFAARDFWDECEDTDWIEAIACDIAREGDDKNAQVYRKGQRVFIWRYWKQPRIDKGAAEIFADLRGLRPKPKALMVDANAVGGGTVDCLRGFWDSEPSAVGDCELIPIDWSGKADDNVQFNRRIDELYHRLRQRLNPDADRESRWALPPDRVLQAMGLHNLTFDKIAAQLNARQYFINEKSRLQVESKKDLRKRKVPSPDVGDAIAALCAEPDEETAQGLF
jgi:phage terminase large subunit